MSSSQAPEHDRWRELHELLGIPSDEKAAPAPPPAPPVKASRPAPVVEEAPPPPPREEAPVAYEAPAYREEAFASGDEYVAEVTELAMPPREELMAEVEIVEEPLAEGSMPRSEEGPGEGGEDDPRKRGRRRGRRGRRGRGPREDEATGEAAPPVEGDLAAAASPSDRPVQDRAPQDRPAPSRSRAGADEDEGPRRGGRGRGRHRRDEEERPVEPEHDDLDADRDEDEDVEERQPRERDEDEPVEPITDWSVPPWHEIVASLYRPER